MSRAFGLILFFTIILSAAACSESYKFQDNTENDANLTMTVDNGKAAENVQGCSGQCPAEGPSNGGT